MATNDDTHSQSTNQSSTATKTTKRSIFDFSSVEDLTAKGNEDDSGPFSYERQRSFGSLPFGESYIAHAPKRHSLSLGRYGFCSSNTLMSNSQRQSLASSVGNLAGSVENLAGSEHTTSYIRLSNSKLGMFSKSTPNLNPVDFQTECSLVDKTTADEDDSMKDSLKRDDGTVNEKHSSRNPEYDGIGTAIKNSEQGTPEKQAQKSGDNISSHERDSCEVTAQKTTKDTYWSTKADSSSPLKQDPIESPLKITEKSSNSLTKTIKSPQDQEERETQDRRSSSEQPDTARVGLEINEEITESLTTTNKAKKLEEKEIRQEENQSTISSITLTKHQNSSEVSAATTTVTAAATATTATTGAAAAVAAAATIATTATTTATVTTAAATAATTTKRRKSSSIKTIFKKLKKSPQEKQARQLQDQTGNSSTKQRHLIGVTKETIKQTKCTSIQGIEKKTKNSAQKTRDSQEHYGEIHDGGTTVKKRDSIAVTMETQGIYSSSETIRGKSKKPAQETQETTTHKVEAGSSSIQQQNAIAVTIETRKQSDVSVTMTSSRISEISYERKDKRCVIERVLESTAHTDEIQESNEGRSFSKDNGNSFEVQSENISNVNVSQRKRIDLNVSEGQNMSTKNTLPKEEHKSSRSIFDFSSVEDLRETSDGQDSDPFFSRPSFDDLPFGESYMAHAPKRHSFSLSRYGLGSGNLIGLSSKRRSLGNLSGSVGNLGGSAGNLSGSVGDHEGSVGNYSEQPTSQKKSKLGKFSKSTPNLSPGDFQADYSSVDKEVASQVQIKQSSNMSKEEQNSSKFPSPNVTSLLQDSDNESEEFQAEIHQGKTVDEGATLEILNKKSSQNTEGEDYFDSQDESPSEKATENLLFASVEGHESLQLGENSNPTEKGLHFTKATESFTLKTDNPVFPSVEGHQNFELEKNSDTPEKDTTESFASDNENPVSANIEEHQSFELGENSDTLGKELHFTKAFTSNTENPVSANIEVHQSFELGENSERQEKELHFTKATESFTAYIENPVFANVEGNQSFELGENSDPTEKELHFTTATETFILNAENPVSNIEGHHSLELGENSDTPEKRLRFTKATEIFTSDTKNPISANVEEHQILELGENSDTPEKELHFTKATESFTAYTENPLFTNVEGNQSFELGENSDTPEKELHFTKATEIFTLSTENPVFANVEEDQKLGPEENSDTAVKLLQPSSARSDQKEETSLISKDYEQREEKHGSSLMKNLKGMFCMLGLKDSPKGGFYKKEQEGYVTVDELTETSVEEVRHRLGEKNEDGLLLNETNMKEEERHPLESTLEENKGKQDDFLNETNMNEEQSCFQSTFKENKEKGCGLLLNKANMEEERHPLESTSEEKKEKEDNFLNEANTEEEEQHPLEPTLEEKKEDETSIHSKEAYQVLTTKWGSPIVEQQESDKDIDRDGSGKRFNSSQEYTFEVISWDRDDVKTFEDPNIESNLEDGRGILDFFGEEEKELLSSKKGVLTKNDINEDTNTALMVESELNSQQLADENEELFDEDEKELSSSKRIVVTKDEINEDTDITSTVQSQLNSQQQSDEKEQLYDKELLSSKNIVVTLDEDIEGTDITLTVQSELSFQQEPDENEELFDKDEKGLSSSKKIVLTQDEISEDTDIIPAVQSELNPQEEPQESEELFDKDDKEFSIFKKSVLAKYEIIEDTDITSAIQSELNPEEEPDEKDELFEKEEKELLSLKRSVDENNEDIDITSEIPRKFMSQFKKQTKEEEQDEADKLMMEYFPRETDQKSSTIPSELLSDQEQDFKHTVSLSERGTELEQDEEADEQMMEYFPNETDQKSSTIPSELLSYQEQDLKHTVTLSERGTELKQDEAVDEQMMEYFPRETDQKSSTIISELLSYQEQDLNHTVTPSERGTELKQDETADGQMMEYFPKETDQKSSTIPLEFLSYQESEPKHTVFPSEKKSMYTRENDKQTTTRSHLEIIAKHWSQVFIILPPPPTDDGNLDQEQYTGVSNVERLNIELESKTSLQNTVFVTINIITLQPKKQGFLERRDVVLSRKEIPKSNNVGNSSVLPKRIVEDSVKDFSPFVKDVRNTSVLPERMVEESVEGDSPLVKNVGNTSVSPEIIVEKSVKDFSPFIKDVRNSSVLPERMFEESVKDVDLLKSQMIKDDEESNEFSTSSEVCDYLQENFDEPSELEDYLQIKESIYETTQVEDVQQELLSMIESSPNNDVSESFVAESDRPSTFNNHILTKKPIFPRTEFENAHHERISSKGHSFVVNHRYFQTRSEKLDDELQDPKKQESQLIIDGEDSDNFPSPPVELSDYQEDLDEYMPLDEHSLVQEPLEEGTAMESVQQECELQDPSKQELQPIMDRKDSDKFPLPPAEDHDELLPLDEHTLVQEPREKKTEMESVQQECELQQSNKQVSQMFIDDKDSDKSPSPPAALSEYIQEDSEKLSPLDKLTLVQESRERKTEMENVQQECELQDSNEQEFQMFMDGDNSDKFPSPPTENPDKFSPLDERTLVQEPREERTGLESVQQECELQDPNEQELQMFKDGADYDKFPSPPAEDLDELSPLDKHTLVQPIKRETEMESVQQGCESQQPNRQESQMFLHGEDSDNFPSPPVELCEYLQEDPDELSPLDEHTLIQERIDERTEMESVQQECQLQQPNKQEFQMFMDGKDYDKFPSPPAEDLDEFSPLDEYTSVPEPIDEETKIESVQQFTTDRSLYNERSFGANVNKLSALDSLTLHEHILIQKPVRERTEIEQDSIVSPVKIEETQQKESKGKTFMSSNKEVSPLSASCDEPTNKKTDNDLAKDGHVFSVIVHARPEIKTKVITSFSENELKENTRLRSRVDEVVTFQPPQKRKRMTNVPNLEQNNERDTLDYHPIPSSKMDQDFLKPKVEISSQLVSFDNNGIPQSEAVEPAGFKTTIHILPNQNHVSTSYLDLQQQPFPLSPPISPTRENEYHTVAQTRQPPDDWSSPSLPPLKDSPSLPQSSSLFSTILPTRHWSPPSSSPSPPISRTRQNDYYTVAQTHQSSKPLVPWSPTPLPSPPKYLPSLPPSSLSPPTRQNDHRTVAQTQQPSETPDHWSPSKDSPALPSSSPPSSPPFKDPPVWPSSPPPSPPPFKDSPVRPSSFHQSMVSPQIAPQARPQVWSYPEIFHNVSEDTTFFKIIDGRRKKFKSNMVVYRGERIKVSRKISVFKNSTSFATWTYHHENDEKREEMMKEDGNYQELSTKNGYQDINEGNEQTPAPTDQVITMTTVSEVMSIENDFLEEQPLRNCAWHLNIDEAIGSFNFSENQLHAAAIDNDNTVLGSQGFTTGQHSWTIKTAGFFCAVGVCYPGEEDMGSSWYKGGKWLWTTDGLQYSNIGGIQRSDFGQWKDEDVLEIYLDCEERTLSIINKETNSKGTLSGFTGEVFPYFNLYKGSSFSLTGISNE